MEGAGPGSSANVRLSKIQLAYPRVQARVTGKNAGSGWTRMKGASVRKLATDFELRGSGAVRNPQG